MGSRYTSAAVSISCIVIKKTYEDKACQYQSVQRCFREYIYVKHIPDFNSLQLSQKKSISKYIHLPKASLD